MLAINIFDFLEATPIEINKEIAQNKDLTICLHHSMNFGDGEYAIKILNNGVVVHNQEEWLDVVYDFL